MRGAIWLATLATTLALASHASAKTVVLEWGASDPAFQNNPTLVFGSPYDLWPEFQTQPIYLKIETLDINPDKTSFEVNIHLYYSYVNYAGANEAEMFGRCATDNGCIKQVTPNLAVATVPSFGPKADPANCHVFAGPLCSVSFGSPFGQSTIGFVALTSDFGPNPLIRATLSTSPFAETAFLPEPATWAMLIVGFGAVGSVIRRRRPAGVHQ